MIRTSVNLSRQCDIRLKAKHFTKAKHTNACFAFRRTQFKASPQTSSASSVSSSPSSSSSSSFVNSVSNATSHHLKAISNAKNYYNSRINYRRSVTSSCNFLNANEDKHDECDYAFLSKLTSEKKAFKHNNLHANSFKSSKTFILNQTNNLKLKSYQERSVSYLLKTKELDSYADMMQPTINYFAHSFIDRCSDKRKDLKWIDEQTKSDKAVFILFHVDKVNCLLKN